MVGRAVANCAGLSFASPKRATDRIPSCGPYLLLLACLEHRRVQRRLLRRLSAGRSIERRQARLPRRARRARRGIRGIDARLAVRPDSAALAGAVEAWSAVYGDAAVRGELGRGRDGNAPQARRTDAGVTGRALGDHGRGRRYRRHELALADGGRLRIGVDGTIERIDADGSTARSWPVGDPDWPNQAIRFGLRPQRSHRHASRPARSGPEAAGSVGARGPAAPPAPRRNREPGRPRTSSSGSPKARFTPRSYPQCPRLVSSPFSPPPFSLSPRAHRAVPAPPRSEAVHRALPAWSSAPPAHRPSGWS